MAEKQTCEACGAELPANAPQGLCPRCLANMGLSVLPPIESSKADFVIECTGTMIGRYKLLEKIGEGGFGIVYMAEQQEPVQRKVALKIIKPGMDTREVIARFEAERQAIALMDHPNIAQVLDAGATEAGRPYFVMELVRGIPITDYCDQKNLPTRDRLQLFMKVCQAVQHAHQKGVIHRDIKPSNVLVTEHDGEPVPKVIDFGVAKALGQKLTEKTLFTGFQHMLGTPAYMSPEQAALSGLDIDTRADIYSLGVLLYELLTGVTPFDTDTFRKAALDEIRRMIQETEPPKPSTRLQTLGKKLTTVAKHRQTEPASLSRLIRGDLDWIVMKCLEKDRQRRYETANGVAADVARHLNSEPVVARPASSAYQLRKFARRHKAGLVTAAALVVLLVAGSVVSTWQAMRAARNAAEAGRSAARATKSSQEELQQRQRAEALAEENRQNLYAARIKLAHQTFEQGNVAGVLDLLDSLRPVSGQADLRGFEWYYLWRLCHSERLNLGHGSRVRAVSFSLDGSTLASGGDDGIIRLWDTRSGQQRGSLEAKGGWITSLAFSPDGKLLVSASKDRIVRVWEMDAGRQTLTFDGGFTNDVTCVACSLQGNLLAAGSGELPVGAGNPMTRYVRNGQIGAIKVWNMGGGAEVAGFNAGAGGVLSLAFSPDGGTLATASPDHTVGIWEARTGRKLEALTNFVGAVFGVAFSPDGKHLATLSWYSYDRLGELQVWEAGNWKAPLVKSRPPPMTCLAFAPDGATLATGGIDGVVRCWDTASGTERASFKGHTEPVWALAFSPNGHTVASGSWDHTVKLWDVDRRQGYDILTNAPGYSVAFSPDGTTLACGGNKLIEIWDVKESRLISRLALPGVGDVLVAISPDGRTLAAGGDGNTAVHLFDLKKRELRKTLPGHKEKIWSLAFSPDSKLLATGGGDLTVKVWDTVDGRALATLWGHTEGVLGMAFTPDGETLVSGSAELSFWNSKTFKPVESLYEPAYRLAISPDGKILASHTGTQGVKLRDLKTRRILATIKAHKDDIYGMAFSADSKTLATASWDGTAKLWNMPTGELLLSLPSDLGTVWSAAFSSDGRTVAIGTGSSRAGQVMLFRAANETEAAPATRSAPAGPTPKLAGFPKPKPELDSSIEPRPATAAPAMVDLSRYYNGSLREGWMPPSPSGTTLEKNLGELPRGLQKFAGVQFDVRGLIQIAGRALNDSLGASYPAEVKGIRIGQKCRALHFLHGTGWPAPDGLTIGRFVIHYRSGLQAEVPLVYGENVSNWWFAPGSDEPMEHAVVAWTGQNAAAQAMGQSLRLYKLTWQNPSPNSPVESLDFVSANSTSSPFLVAITAEP